MPMRRTLFWFCLFLAAGGGAVSAATLQNFQTASLTIVGAGGARHRFTVELAETPAQQEQGLMFRTALAPDSGMLFDFQRPIMATMWMHNTLIPLDMLFVDAKGVIVGIKERAVPESDAIIASSTPVRVVIELNGGTAARLGIRSGDRVLYPIFGPGS